MTTPPHSGVDMTTPPHSGVDMTTPPHSGVDMTTPPQWCSQYWFRRISIYLSFS
jgi:hypothetical protein